MISISTEHRVCSIHFIEGLRGKYLYLSPKPSAYGLRIDLKIKVRSVLSYCCLKLHSTRKLQKHNKLQIQVHVA